jgi:chaperonin cofactor prefoldin
MNFERSTAGVISTDIDKYREVKARKKLTQKNNSLENKLKMLETRIENLEKRVLNVSND